MLEAVILQCEGVLVDNTWQWLQAWRALAEQWLRPVPPPDDALLSIAGRRMVDALPDVLADWFPHRELDETLRARGEQYYKAIREQPLTPHAGVTGLLATLLARGAAVACVGADSLDSVLFHLHEAKLLDAFEVCVGGDEVKEGPPAPDLLRETARRLRVAPGACVAVECSPAGVQAARAAGMRCVAVSTAFAAARLRDAHVVAHEIEGLAAAILSG